MSEVEWLEEQFEKNRNHLRAVAYRMLGSLSEADDALQETWLRLTRSDTESVGNMGGWLTTVTGRVCLDMLRSRKSRYENLIYQPWDDHTGMSAASGLEQEDPELEVAMADSVGLALLVVLEKLNPAERLAFVLHDMFAVPFDEISPIVGRSPSAARQLASRARRRVRGSAEPPDVRPTGHREVVDAFLIAAREGDFSALMSVLDPDVVLRTSDGTLPAEATEQIRGAGDVARSAIEGGARAARPALIDGNVGVVVAPYGRLLMVLLLEIEDEKIAEIEMVTDVRRLGRLDISVPDE